jgi:predicted N-acyltransferase
MDNYTFKIYFTSQDLPENWDLQAVSNIFLQKKYLHVLEQSAPNNMQCYFIGIFNKEILVGVALAQYINTSNIESFGGKNLYCGLRQQFVNRFCVHVLFMGNNMLTGYNAFVFNADYKASLKALLAAKNSIIDILKNQNITINLSVFKDFYEEHTLKSDAVFKDCFKFSTQPNMILNIKESWEKEEDYKKNLSKKYRQQYNRARNKSAEIEKRKLPLEEIIKLEEEIYKLYTNVVNNAAFNTFFLAKNHFSILKKHLAVNFLLYGYFSNNKLVGFNTLIINGNTLETYFLGYDDTIQKENMLYLNMLFDMVGFGIKNRFKKIIFGRTALEIKSSVGAIPFETICYAKHENKIINNFFPFVFSKMNPKIIWTQRHPFL